MLVGFTILTASVAPAAEPSSPISTTAKTEEFERDLPEIKGGNWMRGRELFQGKATCADCHSLNGAGGRTASDLATLVTRDYASTREAVAGAHPRSASPPAGDLLETLKAAEQRDLFTYLLQPPFAAAPLERPNPPVLRTKQEVAELLQAVVAPAPEELKPLKLVLCAGPKDHGAGEHDYPHWQKRWGRLLAMADGVTVSTAWNWPSEEQWASADVILFYFANPNWNAATAPQFDAFLARGGGAVFFHGSINGHKDFEALASQVGLVFRDGASRTRHGQVDLALQPHPLTQGLKPFGIFDESYWNLGGDPARIQVVASGVEEGAARPLLWTREDGPGRVFVSTSGHFTWTYDDPLFRMLAFRGICWAAHQPMDRLAPLVTVGARME